MDYRKDGEKLPFLRQGTTDCFSVAVGWGAGPRERRPAGSRQAISIAAGRAPLISIEEKLKGAGLPRADRWRYWPRSFTKFSLQKFSDLD